MNQSLSSLSIQILPYAPNVVAMVVSCFTGFIDCHPVITVIVKPYSQISSCQDWGDVSTTNSDRTNVDFGKLLSSPNDQDFGLIVTHEFQFILYHPFSDGVNTSFHCFYCFSLGRTSIRSEWYIYLSVIRIHMHVRQMFFYYFEQFANILYIVNNSGPRHEPWRTPYGRSKLTFCKFGHELAIITDWAKIIEHCIQSWVLEQRFNKSLFPFIWEMSSGKRCVYHGCNYW